MTFGKNIRSSLILFFTGAVLGSIFDGFHTHSGTTFYPHPWFLKMAWWVPLLFGAATWAIGDSHVKMDRVLARDKRGMSGSRVIIGLFIFGIIYFNSGFIHNSLKFYFTIGGALFLWLIFDRTWQGVLLGLLTGVAGSCVEITLTHFHFFQYTSPERWGIPYWLPFLYFGASVAVGNLGRLLWEGNV
jgi:hypothetical protein